MAGPFDYTVDVAQPFQSALRGYQGGMAINEARHEQEAQQFGLQKKQLELQAQQQMQMDLADLASNPNASGADYARVITRHPQLSKQIGEGWNVLNAAQQQSRLQQGSQALAAINAGRGDLAAQLFQDHASAARNSGDEATAKQAEMMAKLITDHPETAKTSIAIGLASAMGTEKFASTFSMLGAEQRASEQAPFDLRKKSADASEAEAGAAIKAEEAKYAPKRVPLEIEKLGAELGLTTAQIGQAKASAVASYASANASNANAAKTRREMEQGGAGLLPPDKAIEAAAKLRKEYSDQTKGFQEVQDAYRRIGASENNAVGDISLIFGFMKLLDPMTGVREGEYANAQNAAGVPDRVVNLYNRALRGERLNESQRATFTGQAKKLFEAAERKEKTVRSGIERIGASYGLKRQDLFYDPNNTPEDAPRAQQPAQASRGATAGPAVGTVEGGYRFKGGDPSLQSNWERAR
jgi:hypothetical protein